MSDFDKKRLFDEAVAFGNFINIDAKIATFVSLAEVARTDQIRQRWEEKAQEYRQLKADAELQRAVNHYRESSNE